MKKQSGNLLIFLLFCFSSCFSQENAEHITDFVMFGHVEFCLKDSVKHGLDSAIIAKYGYYYDFDTTKLNVTDYFEYNQNNDIHLALKEKFYENKTEYYSVNTFDKVKFQKLIDNLFLNNTYENKYFSEFEMHYRHYTFYYKTNKGKENTINYFWTDLPDSLEKLHFFIKNILRREDKILVERFDYNDVIKKELTRLQTWAKKNTRDSEEYMFLPLIKCTKIIPPIDFIMK